MPSKLKIKPMKRPRQLGLHLSLVNKSNRGGAHVIKSDKRKQGRLRRELQEELS